MSELKVIVGGDFCPHGPAQDLCEQGRGIEVFGNTLDAIRQADLSIVNLECPLSTRQAPIRKSGPNLLCLPSGADALADAGIDVAVMANNHILDHGPDALKDTLDILDKKKIKHVGAGMTLEDANQPLFIDKSGVRVGLLAFAENEFCNASDLSAGSCPLDPLTNIGQIREARKQCDILLVMIHGGNEYNPIPSPRVVKTYTAFAEAGATAVIGGHTHTPQGSVWRNGVPIVYSTGNLVFPTLRGRHTVMWSTGYLAELTFEDHKAVALNKIPFWADVETGCINRFEPASEQLFIDHLESLGKLAADKAEVAKYYDAWATDYGKRMAQRFEQVAMDSPTPEQCKSFLVIRNVLMCEAHHELVCRFMELMRFDKLQEAKQYADRLAALRDGPAWVQEKLQTTITGLPSK